MEDTLSVKSNESLATSEEYDFVGEKPGASKTPTLDFTGGLSELKDALKEPNSNMNDTVDQGKHIGHSTFYGSPVDVGKDPLSVELSPVEKQDSMKLDSSSDDETSISDVDQECTIFAGVTYLGAAQINAPKSEAEIHRNMAILNEQSQEQGIKVSISVPLSSQGLVVLYDAATNSVISRYEVHRILFYARGSTESSEANCFAFTWSHGESQETAIFQCHVFRCDIVEAVSRVSADTKGNGAKGTQNLAGFDWNHVGGANGKNIVSELFRDQSRQRLVAMEVKGASKPYVTELWSILTCLFRIACFAKAFQRVPRSMSSSVTSTTIDVMSGSMSLPEARILMYVFEVNLEIKEEDGKGSYSTVGKDKNGFRIKTNLEKQLSISIKQVSDNGPQLYIERCFGVLVAAGRHVKHSDMQLLERNEQSSSSASNERNCTTISATWDPTEDSFEALNTETPKDVKQYMTVAVDLVIRGIREPVRFLIETAVRVLEQSERNFWYFQRKSLTQQFFLNLKESAAPDLNEVYYEVLNMETSGELDRNLLNLNLNLSSLIQSPSITSIDILTPKDECHSDGDEPLLSGTGLVSKDCSEDVLESWADILSRWKQTKQRPKQLASLVKLGIPEALRGEVWQRLAGVEESSAMMEEYRILITKESSCENVIQRDIARTFPAHDFFKKSGGLGQDSLYRVSKAYAVYDSEVGYCQGLSFLAATLLLHMPEEQAFCVLVKLMYDYGLRDLYKDGFDNLYLRLYQLNRLIEEQLPPLWTHFNIHNIEMHMFASQWFLTLFTARFPLYFVFHIIDVFLLQGIDTLFHMALALLYMCKKDLLLLDFEGILKYFRVSLPKKCRTEEAARQLIKLACSIKVKKLKKYETDFIALKEKAEMEANKANEVEQLRAMVARCEDEKKMMMDEITQLKEMLKREVSEREDEQKRNAAVISELKLVRHRLDLQLQAVKNELNDLKANISSCLTCSVYIEPNKDSPKHFPSDQINELARVRELELELAQTKLAKVEAECKNQTLTHQLRTTEHELTTAKNSWPPWMSKALTSIKEVANKKEFTNFTISQPGVVNAPTFISHINTPLRRDSVPLKSDTFTVSDARRDSAPPVIKDSQSCSSLKTHN